MTILKGEVIQKARGGLKNKQTTKEKSIIKIQVELITTGFENRISFNCFLSISNPKNNNKNESSPAFINSKK
jgi:hypothetical protein